MNSQDLLFLKILLRLRELRAIHTDTPNADLIVERIFVDQGSDLVLRSPLDPLVELGLVRRVSVLGGSWQWTVSAEGDALIREALAAVGSDPWWVRVDDSRLCLSTAWIAPN